MKNENIIILGIESSCDETGVAIVNDKHEILSNQLYTQIDQHAVYGGVVPEIAARAHVEKIDILVKEALKEANLTLNDIDGIAATAGPGLIGGLFVGTSFAKTLSLATDKPFIPVNHLEGHALMSRLTHKTEFPFLLLLVSGGHSQILLVRDVADYELIGTTIDDAVGEAFDKTAKLLGLPYPGGAYIEKFSKEGNPKRFQLPRPLIHEDNCNFSYSGLKSAVRKIVMDLGDNITEQDKYDICASFQKTVVDIIVNKIQRALDKVFAPSINAVVLSGGVARNTPIREAVEKLAEKNGVECHIPDPALCTDNGVMIAWAGLENYKLEREGNLDFKPKPRWPLTELV